MSDIPGARERLLKLAEKLQPVVSSDIVAELREIERSMWREPYARKPAPRRNRAPTDEEAENIRRYAHAHPWLSQQEIAVNLGFNHGRVSEALHHLR